MAGVAAWWRKLGAGRNLFYLDSMTTHIRAGVDFLVLLLAAAVTAEAKEYSWEGKSPVALQAMEYGWNGCDG